MFTDKEKAKEFLDSLRTLIRAEVSAGLTLVTGDLEGYKIFNILSDEIATGILNKLAGE